MSTEDFFGEKDAVQGKAAWVSFLGQYQKKEQVLYLFFEGEDDEPFYEKFIEIVFDGFEWETFDCNGKENLYICHADIDWSKYDKNRVLFFTDRDYDDIIGKEPPVNDENIFITKYYAIENYLVCEEVIDKMLKRYMKIKDQEILDHLKENFLEQLKNFSERIMLISVWGIYHRKKEISANFNDIKVSKFFSFKVINSGKSHPWLAELPALELTANNEVRKKRMFLLSSQTKAATPSSCWKEMLSIAREIREIPPKQHIRGKYELWFLVEGYKQVVNSIRSEINTQIKDYNKSCSSNQKKRKLQDNLQLTEKNAVGILASTITIPEDIRNFLEHHRKQLNN